MTLFAPEDAAWMSTAPSGTSLTSVSEEGS